MDSQAASRAYVGSSVRRRVHVNEAEQTLKSTDALENTDRDRLQPQRHDDGQFCALETSCAVNR
jgi:hypothetical protein